ncbi:hypothetical protein F2Q68_00039342 [Brassica cretica]|uniref:Uncharacterized protein n=1 Tax=Brassica cretica TaxID=69181 RepID=A0A8S9MDT6_BRACR|nr:hypothetical protein F2Q68_00039342 [Brassica cretica]
MAQSDSPSGDESPSTEAAPTAAAFADTILERMAQQDAVQKATNEQLAAVTAILAPLAGNSADPAPTTCADTEQPRNRRRVQVILTRPSSSSDEEEDATVCDSQEHPAGLKSESSDPSGACDLRSKFKRKSQAAESTHGFGSDLHTVINKSRAKQVEGDSVRPHLKPRVLDLRDRLNSRSEDLRIRLNRPKSSDLR